MENNILVKVDQNNLIYIDPNSVVNDGKVYPRNVNHEEMVMYVNLEADLIPRTTLIADGNKTSLSSVAKGTFNMMKSSNGEFDTTWTNAYNGNDDSFFNKRKDDSSSQSFGIESINITIKGGNFVPQININFVDVRGKTMFESPKNSPYKAFFHLPWPIFYLTVKGFYGKAIRYRLHMTKFSTKFNQSSGNYEITTAFIGSTYAFLTDIPLMGLLNAPFMYLSEKEGTTKFNEKTQTHEKNILRTSKGFIQLQSVYDEYKEKGYLPKDFPTRTLREIITISQSLDSVIEREIIDQKVDKRIFAGMKEFETIIQGFDDYITFWSEKHLSSDFFVKNEIEYRKLAFTENNDLEKNVKKGGNDATLENGIKGYVKSLNDCRLFTQDIKNDGNSKFKKVQLTFKNNISNIDTYIEKENNVYGISIGKLRDDIKKIKQSFNEQKLIIEDKIEEEINKIIKDKNKGLGFEPTIRNIFGVVMANAEVYIRLLKDVHRKSFDNGKERAIKINKLSNETKGEPIFPWPEIMKLSPSTKQKVVMYPGDKELRETLDASNTELWPEVDFVENYHAVATKRVDNLANKEGGVNNNSYFLPKDAQENEVIDISTLLTLNDNVPYSSHSIINVLYEIWERSKLVTYYDSFNVDTIMELAKIEFDNIQRLVNEDYDIVSDLKRITTSDGLVSALFNYSPFERYPYYLDSLPTTYNVKQLVNQFYKLEQYSTIISPISQNNDDKFEKLSKNLTDYKIEPYRNKIYPFTSEEHLAYIKKTGYGNENFKFNNLLKVDTTNGLISSTITDWLKPNTTVFSQKINGENILNTPYFHKQLFYEFNQSKTYGKYSGSAYLLLNSIPFLELSDNIGSTTTPLSSVFKEIGASHYIPYHLILKWGSIYHRYKTYLTEGTDILSGFLTNNVTQPIVGNVMYDSTGNGTVVYGGYDKNFNKTLDVTYDDNIVVGYHPFYSSIFNQVVNGYGLFDVTSPSDFTISTKNNRINVRTRTDNVVYSTLYTNNSHYVSTDNYYTLLPSDGSNELPNMIDTNFGNSIQNNFRVIWEDQLLNMTYSGKTFPEYNETLENITSLKGLYRKVSDLIAVFHPTILDKFEQYFLDFSTLYINPSTTTVKHNNFQLLLKEMVTVKNDVSDSTEVNILINNLKIKQKNKLKEIDNEIRSSSNVFKLTLPNPKEIIPHIWDGMSGIFTDNTFSYGNYNSEDLLDFEKYLKLYIGNDSKYLDFFVLHNIELNEENIIQFRSLVYIYAGYLKSGNTRSKKSFQTYIRDNIILNDSTKGSANRHSIFLTILIRHFSDLTATKTNTKLDFKDGHNEGPIKLELYNFFKNFNDRWVSGNSLGQRLLIEEFLFLDKANRDIGDKAYLSMDRIASLGDKNNIKLNLYSAISMLIQGSGFNMRALPAYINFYGTNYNNKMKLTPSKKVANNLFNTFLEVDYQESSPKIILQYTGPTSAHFDMSGVSKNNLFKDDSYNIGNPNNNPIIVSEPIDNSNVTKSNKVVAFEVNIGDQNQSIFKSFQVDQTSIRNTTESFILQENLARSETGTAAHQVDIGLYDIYRQSSYTCEVTCLGNVMIQPTMYFYLNNVPMFNGTYWIMEVSHSIANNNILTTFKGTRMSNSSPPDLDDSFMSSYRVLFEKIINNAITKQKEEDITNSNTTNDKVIVTGQGSFIIDLTDLNENDVVKSSGVSEFGVRYNGFEGEKYIQKIQKGKIEYFRAIISIMGSNDKVNDNEGMTLFNNSKHVTVNSTDMDFPNTILWKDIKTSKNYFYSLRFDINLKLNIVDKILSSKTTFYNPKDLNKTVSIDPLITKKTPNPIINPSNVRGPITIGPAMSGVGISLSSSLARKIGVNEGDSVYFTME